MDLDKKSLNTIVEKYTAKQHLYKEFGEKIESLIKKRLKATTLKDYFLSNRAKDISSFKKKLEKNYANPLEDITDFTGVRVIVCYTNEIKTVIEIIENEFDIDPKNSVNKANTYNPTTFGYLSVHKIVQNSIVKSKSPEWKKYNNLKAEIQIRTSLQHSWAVVSHTLYKNENEVPKGLQRRLNRLAGLFEIADQEFFEIKRLNEKYKKDLKINFDNDETDKIEINITSILEYILRNQTIITAIKTARDNNLLIVDNLQKEYYDRLDSSSVIEVCSYFGIETIKELGNLINLNKSGNLKFIKSLAKKRTLKFTKPFILFLLIAKAKHQDFPMDYLKKKYKWESEMINFIINEAKKYN